MTDLEEYKEACAYWESRALAAEARLAKAVEVIKPFAMLCVMDVKESDADLTSVHPMVAAGRLRDARDFLTAAVSGPLCGQAADRIDAMAKVIERLVNSWDVNRAGWNYAELDFALKDARRVLAAVSGVKEP